MSRRLLRAFHITSILVRCLSYNSSCQSLSFCPSPHISKPSVINLVKVVACRMVRSDGGIGKPTSIT